MNADPPALLPTVLWAAALWVSAQAWLPMGSCRCSDLLSRPHGTHSPPVFNFSSHLNKTRHWGGLAGHISS